MFEIVLKVLNNQLNGCVCIPTTVWAKKVSREVDANHASSFTDCS